MKSSLIVVMVTMLSSLSFGLSGWESTSFGLFAGYFVYFIHLIGRKVIIFELTVLLALLTWLVVPVLFYHFFNEQNDLAILWDKYMLVSSEDYFSFVLPATLLMALGIHLPLQNHSLRTMPVELFQRIRGFLKGKTIVGYSLIGIGLLSSLVKPYSPGSLQFVFYLLEHLSFVGLLYLYFSRIPVRKSLLLLGVGVLLVQSISSGMFGELIYISFLAASILLSVTQLSTWKKWLGITLALFLVIILQSVKHEYRSVAWNQGASPVFFAKVVSDKITNPETILDPYNLFTIAARANQGWLIAKTMYHVPQHKPYAYGKTIALSFAAVIVPRIIWPTKPESGGKANLKRFWGMEIKGYSMNIGPIGEAYANFGKVGGILFMFFYGLLLNVFLSLILGIVKSRPTVLLWFPILFLFPVGTETDILSTLNPLFKISLFIGFMYLVLPVFSKIRLG